MTANNWIWMPHPGHFIGASKCRFHLNTYVGGYIVSTVGEYVPDSQVQEILAKSRGITLEGMGDYREADWMRKVGFERIGCDRTYETMVFKAQKGERECCPFEPIHGMDEDLGDDSFRGYNSADEATRGHMELCRKWAAVTP